jgi:hypothetical protein
MSLVDLVAYQRPSLETSYHRRVDGRVSAWTIPLGLMDSSSALRALSPSATRREGPGAARPQSGFHLPVVGKVDRANRQTCEGVHQSAPSP